MTLASQIFLILLAWRRFGPAARQALLANENTPPSILLLGPSDAGKSTIYRAALALAGESVASSGDGTAGKFAAATEGRGDVADADAELPEGARGGHKGEGGLFCMMMFGEGREEQVLSWSVLALHSNPKKRNAVC